MLNVPAAIVKGPERAKSQGTLYDMSGGGAYITATIEIDLGMPAYVRFYIDGLFAEAVGEVIRTAPFGDALGIGLRFRVGNDPLADFLERLDRTREADRPEILAGIRKLEIQLG